MAALVIGAGGFFASDRNLRPHKPYSLTESQKPTLESIAKKRRNQAKRFGYLGYQIPCPIMEIIRSKLDEIGTIRNSLVSRFRPLKVDDVEVIKQNAKQALLGVESWLAEMLFQPTAAMSGTRISGRVAPNAAI